MPHPVVHTEIRSADPDATRAFYAELFGWTVASEGAYPGYTFIDTGAEGGPYVAIGPRQATDDEVLFFVGVEDVRAQGGERGRHFRFAAADAAGETDEVRAHSWPRHKYQPLINSGPKKSATPPAIARYGPNASGMLWSRPLNTISEMPMTAPTTDESRMMSGSICQPSHAPSAASSLKSP